MSTLQCHSSLTSSCREGVLCAIAGFPSFAPILLFSQFQYFCKENHVDRTRDSSEPEETHGKESAAYGNGFPDDVSTGVKHGGD